MYEQLLAAISEYLDPKLLMLVVFLVIIGIFLKKWETLKDKYIVVILWGTGIIFTILWFGVVDGRGLAAVIFVEGIVQGTFVTGLAVLGHQTVKQALKKE